MGINYFKSLMLTLIFSILTSVVSAQYCVPIFSIGCTSSDFIGDFIVEDSSGVELLSHLGTGCSPNAYGDYTGDSSLHLVLNADEDYDFKVTHGTTSQYVRIWIDFDGNEDFEDAGELVYVSTVAGSSSNPTLGTFTIPDIQGVLVTRMRVKTTFSTSDSFSCTQLSSYGEAHDYTVTIVGENEGCYSPDDFEVTVLSSSEVEVTWSDSPDVTVGYDWHLMSQGEHPDSDTPIQSGVSAVGDESVTIDSLLENKFYDFYIHGKCANSEVSVWRIVEFFIPSEGADCSNPIEVTTLPYSNINDTVNFLNLLRGGPGDNCGAKNEYFYGNDVVYQYTADKDYLLVVSLDNIGEEYSAVFVYESCADIGVSCAEEGSVAEDSTDSHGFDMLVEEGETYYFVVSSAEPTASFDYTLNINGYSCNDIPAPTIADASPYFMSGDNLSSLEKHINFLRLSQGIKWYSDVGLTTQIADPDNEPLVDGVSYYVTQEVIGCEGAALQLTPIEFDCSVLDPVLITPTVELCVPGGFAKLEARTSAAGDQLFWYETPTSSKPIEKGKLLDLGYVNETVSYWVTEARLIGEEFEKQAEIDPPALSNTTTSNAGLLFTVKESFNLKSVTVLSTAAAGGSIQVDIRDIGNGNEVVFTTTIPVPGGGTTTNPVPVVIPIDFELDVGDYRILRVTSGTTVGLGYMSAANSGFPYILGNDVGTINTGSTQSGTTTLYYYFFDWTIDSFVVACESDREEVLVVVSDDIPEAPTVDKNYIFCGQAVYTLADIEVEGEELVWYDRVGNELAEDTEVEDGKTYYIVDNAGGCVSDIAEVLVSIQEISELPVADVEQEFTEGQTLADLDVSGIQLKWYADAEKEQLLDIDTQLEDQLTYYVTQTQRGKCESETLAIKVTKVLGIEELDFQNFEYFPNPVQNQLTLINEKEIQNIEVFDMLGRTVFNQMNIHRNRVELDFENIASGSYLMKVYVENSVKIIHIIKK